MRCSEQYDTIRNYLLGAVVPEYMIRSSLSKGGSERTAPFAAVSPPIRNAITTLSSDGIQFLARYESGTDWEDQAPTDIERDGIDEIVSTGYCSVDSPDTIRSRENDLGKKPNSIKYGVSCDERYKQLRKLAIDILLPQVPASADRY